MKKMLFLFCLLFGFVSMVSSQQPVRLWDDDVKKLIEEADKSSDKFRDAFKKVASITTRTGAQVDVQQYMQDYRDTFNRFKEGFDSQGAPTTDLMNLLRMTSEIDGVMIRNPDAAGAGSEWQAHKFNMERLAQAFRTTIGEDAAPPRRMSDSQVKANMETIKGGCKALTKSVKDAMKKDPSFDKSAIQATEQTLKTLEKRAETMKNLFNDRKPLGVEMQEFFKQMDTVKAFLTEHQLDSRVQTQWDSLWRKASQLSDEYGTS